MAFAPTPWKKIAASNYTYKKQLDAFHQRGQTCGIYALEAALKGHGVNTPPATYGEREIICRKLWKKLAELFRTPLSLRQLAKWQKKTKVGELFNVDHVAELGIRYKKDVTTDSFADETAFRTIVKKQIDGGRFIMVAFQPHGDTGKPTLGTGKNAHWCVIFGYSKAIPMDRVLAVHGWGGYFEFNVHDLVSSNKTLTTFAESPWYKYTGTDRQVVQLLERMGYSGPMYMEANTCDDLIEAVYPDTHSASYKKERKNFRCIVLPKADLSVGLAHKLVVI